MAPRRLRPGVVLSIYNAQHSSHNKDYQGQNVNNAVMKKPWFRGIKWNRTPYYMEEEREYGAGIRPTYLTQFVAHQ